MKNEIIEIMNYIVKLKEMKRNLKPDTFAQVAQIILHFQKCYLEFDDLKIPCDNREIKNCIDMVINELEFFLKKKCVSVLLDSLKAAMRADIAYLELYGNSEEIEQRYVNVLGYTKNMYDVLNDYYEGIKLPDYSRDELKKVGLNLRSLIKNNVYLKKDYVKINKYIKKIIEDYDCDYLSSKNIQISKELDRFLDDYYVLRLYEVDVSYALSYIKIVSLLIR